MASSSTSSSSASAGAAAQVPLILRAVYECAKIVNVAGRVLINVRESGKLGIVEKGIDDLQTKADRVAQQYIIQKLYKKFPNVFVIGEEPESKTIDEDYDELVSASSIDGTVSAKFKHILRLNVPDEMLSIREEQIVIWVDPLDGTSEYTKGMLDSVTVLVGLAVAGTPVAGVIHSPFVMDETQIEPDGHGRTLWGIPEVGFGGFVMKSPPKGLRIITTTTRKSNAVGDSCLSGLKPDRIVRIGGSGHKAALLLDGKAHAYVSPRTQGKKWDTCAFEAILRAIGGKLTDIHGKPYEYHKEAEWDNDAGVLATGPGEDHSWYVKRC